MCLWSFCYRWVSRLLGCTFNPTSHSLSLRLYWLGFYEASSTKTYPALFHVDHSVGVFYGVQFDSIYDY